MPPHPVGARRRLRPVQREQLLVRLQPQREPIAPRLAADDARCGGEARALARSARPLLNPEKAYVKNICVLSCLLVCSLGLATKNLK